LRIIRKYLFSVSYRLFRFLVKHLVFIYQKISNRDKDLESIVEFGDKNLAWINNNLGSLAFNFTIPKGLETELFDLKFKSPLVAASFKSDENLLDIWMKLGLGGSTYKTVMKSERSGNPRPRMQQIRLEREQCLVNALGLPGSGIDLFTKELLTSPLWTYNRPLGISIGGENLDEYISNFNDIEKVIKGNVPDIYYYELNISCPNNDTGSCIGDDLDVLENLVEHVRVNCSATVSLKISPDWSNDQLRKIGAIIKKKDKMFVNAGNTQFRTVESLGLKPGQLPRNGGGLSGVAIFPRTLEMIHVFSDINIKIMATGGISTVHHLRAARDAGASLFGMATALIMDPYCIPKINDDLARY
jgi:dihydroorotate dehydrogenase